VFAEIPDAAPVVRHSQAGLAITDASFYADADPAALRAECMLDAVYRSFIQNEPDRYGPINAQFQLVRFDIDFDTLYLLTDRAAQSADIIGKFDSSTILSGCELIMRKRDRIDSACDVIQRAMNLSG
jgi:hypothetical protein